jgi:hypothetical protein
VLANEVARKANIVHFADKVAQQIEDHQVEKIKDKAERRLAQEARLEDEKTFKSKQQLDKDRRVREQRAYR